VSAADLELIADVCKAAAEPQALPARLDRLAHLCPVPITFNDGTRINEAEKATTIEQMLAIRIVHAMWRPNDESPCHFAWLREIWLRKNAKPPAMADVITILLKAAPSKNFVVLLEEVAKTRDRAASARDAVADFFGNAGRVPLVVLHSWGDYGRLSPDAGDSRKATTLLPGFCGPRLRSSRPGSASKSLQRGGSRSCPSARIKTASVSRSSRTSTTRSSCQYSLVLASDPGRARRLLRGQPPAPRCTASTSNSHRTRRQRATGTSTLPPWMAPTPT
jgi:hypothetical protein